jgi:phage gp29-like protein
MLSLSSQIVRRASNTAKRDIRDWKNAETRANSATDPRYTLLQDVYTSVLNDALLASQVNNRIERTCAMAFELTDRQGVVQDEPTALMARLNAMNTIIRAIVEARFYGYSLIEIIPDKHANTRVVALPRRNIDPVFGRFFPDAANNDYIAYREMKEFGTYILEFRDPSVGLLNKTVPHVLFKKFAQSCWSELCEIYGIPPRYIKTNTTDPEMLARAEQMMRDMGSAAAFVIDTNEDFSFANGITTNGDVYRNLINLCNNEISMLVSGAIIGQDTENGNYSKEQANKEILDKLCLADQRRVEEQMNAIVMPALCKVGLLPKDAQNLEFRFAAAENNDKLWQMVKDIIPYKEVDTQWLTEKFGIPVSDRTGTTGNNQTDEDRLSARIAAILSGGDNRFFA